MKGELSVIWWGSRLLFSTSLDAVLGDATLLTLRKVGKPQVRLALIQDSDLVRGGIMDTVVSSLIQGAHLRGRTLIGDRYDWTTRVLDNGNDWRKFRVVPRTQPLRPRVLYFV